MQLDLHSNPGSALACCDPGLSVHLQAVEGLSEGGLVISSH